MKRFLILLSIVTAQVTQATTPPTERPNNCVVNEQLEDTTISYRLSGYYKDGFKHGRWTLNITLDKYKVGNVYKSGMVICKVIYDMGKIVSIDTRENYTTQELINGKLSHKSNSIIKVSNSDEYINLLDRR